MADDDNTLRSGNPEMITMSGAVPVRPAGAENSAAADRRLSARTRRTTTKVRLFPRHCLVYSD